MTEAVETNPINDLIKHSLDQDFTKAGKVFGDIMTLKMNDILDQEKIRLSDQIYNGVEDEKDEEQSGSENDTDENDDTVSGESPEDQDPDEEGSGTDDETEDDVEETEEAEEDDQTVDGHPV